MMWSVLQCADLIIEHSACFLSCHTGRGLLVALHVFLCDLRCYLSLTTFAMAKSM